MGALSIDDIFAPKDNLDDVTDDLDLEVEAFKRALTNASSAAPPGERKKLSVNLNIMSFKAKPKSG